MIVFTHDEMMQKLVRRVFDLERELAEQKAFTLLVAQRLFMAAEVLANRAEKRPKHAPPSLNI